jgi:hypothetical protein
MSLTAYPDSPATVVIHGCRVPIETCAYTTLLKVRMIVNEVFHQDAPCAMIAKLIQLNSEPNPEMANLRTYLLDILPLWGDLIEWDMGKLDWKFNPKKTMNIMPGSNDFLSVDRNGVIEHKRVTAEHGNPENTFGCLEMVDIASYLCMNPSLMALYTPEIDALTSVLFHGPNTPPKRKHLVHALLPLVRRWARECKAPPHHVPYQSGHHSSSNYDYYGGA